jgi:CheY-like chemotaxis protein
MTVRRAVRELKIANKLVVAGDGEEALALLDQDRELPCLILLDINMPRMNGIETLKRLKACPRLRRIPVVMLTTSKDAGDRLSSFDHCVAGYMVKPVDYERFLELMRVLSLYWSFSESVASP